MRKQGEAINIFEKKLQEKIVEKGHYAGMRIMPVESYITLKNGKKINLANDEKVLQFHANRIVTSKIDFSEYKTHLKVYKLTGASIQVVASKVIDHGEVNIVPTKNGNIIITDESEGQGGILEIYSKELRLIKNYIPPSGFSQSAIDTDKDKTVVVLSPLTQASSAKMVMINTQLQIIKESDIGIQSSITDIHLLPAHLCVFSYNKLTVLNHSGELLWEKIGTYPFREAQLAYDNISKTLYTMVSTKKLLSINIETGNLLWKKEFAELFTSSETNTIIRPNDLKATAKGVVILISKWRWNPEDAEEITFLDTKILALNNNGIVTNQLQFSQMAKVFKIINGSDYIKVISNTQIFEYEH